MSTTTHATRLRVTNRRQPGFFGTLARVILFVSLVGGLGVASAGLAAYTHFARDLPELRPFEEIGSEGVTRFHAADGQVAGEWYKERRIALTWRQIPRQLVLAFLATEDARFFEHHGIDFRGVARALVTNLRAGRVQEGASTITQQLAKTFVGHEKSYARKAKEAILARRMETLYDKTEILTWYLNTIYLGHGSYGVQAAAQNYFRKSVWALGIGEMATLAGLPQSPSRVNPYVSPDKARERMKHVLRNMRERGWITDAELKDAMDTELKVYPLRDILGDRVPYYTERARKEVMVYWESREGDASWLDAGLVVSMSVEPGLQRAGAEALQRALEALAKKQGYPGPLGSLDADTFRTRNSRWLPPDRPPRKGERLLGRVTSVKKKEARVEFDAASRGRISLTNTKWAGPYTEFPRDNKGRFRSKKRQKASFKPKLKDMRKAFSVGDIGLFEVIEGPPDALEVILVPIPMMEGALVSFPTITGGADVLVGGWDFDRSQVHRAFSLRQTGSTMKPVVYGKAYDIGVPPSAIFSGAPFREGKFNPTGNTAKDDMMLWEALSKSENAVSLRVLQRVLAADRKVRKVNKEEALSQYQHWGRQLGLPRVLKGNTSEVLGADQTPFSMAEAFGIFANDGMAVDTHRIRKLVDREGRVLIRNISPLDPHATTSDTLIALTHWWTPPETRIPQDVAFIVKANLAEVVKRGTAKAARKHPLPVAGKTGTLPFDVWFVGFSPYRSSAVWLGADRRERWLGLSRKKSKVYGSTAALPAWLDFMAHVEKGKDKTPLTRPIPDGITYVNVDPVTGLKSRGDGRSIPHRRGTAPTEYTPEEDDIDQILDLETEF